MCDTHNAGEKSWMRKIVLMLYGKWVEDTLGFYLFLGRMGKKPVFGPVVRFFAGQFGKYLHGGRVATVNECLGIVARAGHITVLDCACRVRQNACESPLRTCIVVNTGAEVFGKLRSREDISKEKAGEIIAESYRHGLIRTVTHCLAPDVYALCNCCTCCCVPYRLRSEFRIENAMVNGREIAQLNPVNCQKCGKCVEICPEKAPVPESGTIDRLKCLGCGLCQDSCTYGALEMVERIDSVAPVTPGLMGRMLMYISFFGVILPLAAGYKISRS